MKKPEADPEKLLEIIRKPTSFRRIGSKTGYRH